MNAGLSSGGGAGSAAHGHSTEEELLDQEPARIRTLRLGDMVFNRRGPVVRRVVHSVVSLALRLFFRRIETANVSEVPYKGALIFVMNHPNGLIDPALIFTALPRKVSFLAKSTLFRIPVLAYLLRVVEALPVFRKVDAADVSQNSETFRASHALLQRGGAIALFPEGVSHDSPKLLPLKTGAARIALGAISGFAEDEKIHLRIVPVGLFYTRKTTFRSEALLHFGEPFTVESVEPDETGDLPREAVRDLTLRIDETLREVTLNAETDAEIQTADQAANLFLSASETFDLKESLSARFEFLRKYLEANERKASTGGLGDAEKVSRQISDYKMKLRRLGLEPENLSLSSRPFSYVFQHFLVRAWLILLFSPLAIIGITLHFPAYQVSKLLASRYTHHGVDDIISTVKIISGIILMPLTWIIAAGLIYVFWDWRLALLAIPLSFFCGYVALRSLEEIEDMRGWFRAAWVFFTRRKLFLELLLERRALHRELMAVKQTVPK